MAEDPAPAGRGERTAWLCSLAVASAVLAFAGFQYCMPVDVHSSWGLNPEGAANFRTLLRQPSWPGNGAAFRHVFLVLVAVMAAAYFGLLVSIAAGAAIPEARVARL